MFSKKIFFLLFIASISFLFYSCDTVQTNNSAKIYIKYNGVVSNDNTLNSYASFSLINDTTVSVKYTGYSKNSPIYNIEELQDTGWVVQGRAWCGTGLQDIVLKAGSSIELRVYYQNYASTWRILLGIKISGENRTLRSESMTLNLPTK